MSMIAAGLGVASLAVTAYGMSDQAAAGRTNAASSSRIAGIQNDITGFGNAQAHAEGGLARWTQSLNNQRIMAAGGAGLGAMVTNFARQRDAMVRGSFSDGIAAAEQVGMARAAQASSGVQGSVVDTINGTMALRRAMAEQVRADTQDMQDRDFRVAYSNTHEQMTNSIDSSVLLDNVNAAVAHGTAYSGPNTAEIVARSLMAGAQGYMGAGGKFGGTSTAKTEGLPVESAQTTFRQSEIAAQNSAPSASFAFDYGVTASEYKL